MGQAMLQGWLERKVENRIYILDPAGLPPEFVDYAPNPVSWYENVAALAAQEPKIDVIVMAVKPQIMADACAALKPLAGANTPLLSIAAGQSIAVFETYFGAGHPVIRAMPNTPSSIGQGVSVCVANPHVTPEQKEQATRLLEAVGHVEWIKDETLMDAVTALSGSGPAYVFLLIEALAGAGEKAGLSRDLAMTLARRTVIGAGALAAHMPDSAASTLRENVTSPGGTTAAALDVLMRDQNGLQSLMDEAVAAAKQRSIDLSGT